MNLDLEKVITIAGDLPTMSVVATKVMQLVEDEKATAEELAKIVSSDPAVAARIIKISNSALYSCQREIKTIPRAIVLLGFNTIKSFVIAASLKDTFKHSGLTEKMLWEHSFGAALAARIIVGECQLVSVEEAFLAGLLHDIGKILMYNNDFDRFQSLMEHCYNERLLFEEVELTHLPFTHAELGGYVLKKWNFPDVIVNSVMQHHNFEFTDGDDFYLRALTAVVSLADLFCLKLGIGERNPHLHLRLADSEAAKLLKLEEKQLARLLNGFEAIFEKDKGYFY